MRATSLRRAPQRNIIDRTLGETAPLAPGACPHCFRVVTLTATGRRRGHRDPARGDRCTGSGVLVRTSPVHLELLPQIAAPDRCRTIARSAQPLTLVDGRTIRYEGGSDRTAAHGRAVCDGCGRHVPLNSDGSIRRHRVRHNDPATPYCTGTAS